MKIQLTDAEYDALQQEFDDAQDKKRLQQIHRQFGATLPAFINSCTGSCNQGRQCDCVPDYPTPYDVESQAPWLTGLIAAAAILGTVAVCALLAMVKVV